MNNISTINLLRKNSIHFVNKDDYYQIVEGIKKKNKIDMINTIELFRKYKRFFTNQEEYFQIMNNLYLELSNLNINLNNQTDTNLNNQTDTNLNNQINIPDIKLIKINNILDMDEQIFMYNELTKSTNLIYILDSLKVNNVSELNPQYDLLFDQYNIIELNPTIQYNLQDEPVINPNYNKLLIVSKIKLLLHLCEMVTGYKNKVIVSLIIFDELFKNYRFVIEHQNFKITVKNKITEFKTQDNDKVNEILIKYNLDINILDKMINHMEK